MLPINRLVRYMAALVLLVLAATSAHFDIFNLLILQGSVFALLLLACLMAGISAELLAGVGCALIAASGILFLLGQTDQADLVSTVAFKIIVIAVIAALVSLIKPSRHKSQD
jgi:hypothetical protein